jgi:threonine dehydrogenase-like Zn-dependent dehydrogenase
MSSYEVAMEMIQKRELTLEEMITHRFALDDYREAFKTVKRRPDEVIKAVFEL